MFNLYRFLSKFRKTKLKFDPRALRVEVINAPIYSYRPNSFYSWGH